MSYPSKRSPAAWTGTRVGLLPGPGLSSTSRLSLTCHWSCSLSLRGLLPPNAIWEPGVCTNVQALCTYSCAPGKVQWPGDRRLVFWSRACAFCVVLRLQALFSQLQPGNNNHSLTAIWRKWGRKGKNGYERPLELRNMLQSKTEDMQP